jgi:hypothetical protein
MSVPACMVTVRFAAISATLADPTAVPTLERWALMLLGAVLGGCAVWRKRRAR